MLGEEIIPEDGEEEEDSAMRHEVGAFHDEEKVEGMVESLPSVGSVCSN